MPIGKKTISKSDLDKSVMDILNKMIPTVVTQVKDALAPIEDSENVAVQTVIDPELENLYKVRTEIIKQLVNPKMLMVRGKRGSTLINQTQESLNAVNAEIQGWNHRKTRTKTG